MKHTLRNTVGVLLSILLLVWALRDVSFSEVTQRFRSADLALLGFGVAISLGGMWFRALRWGVLLHPVARGVGFRARIAATFIGFAVNNILPARIGEFARAFSLARLSPVPAAAAFATLVIERLLDGIVLVALLFVALASPGFPTAVRVGGVDLRSAALLIALGMGGIAAVLLLAVVSPGLAAKLVHASARPLPHRFRDFYVGAARSFSRGLAVLRSPWLFAASLALAIGQWLFLAYSFLFAFRAFGIDDVPFVGAVFLQSLISLAVAIPSSPGFFGPFEAAARIGLGLWEVPAEQAISFAIGFHLAGFLPVTVIGIYYVWRLDLKWSEMRSSEKAVEAEAFDTPGPAGGGSSGSV